MGQASGRGVGNCLLSSCRLLLSLKPSLPNVILEHKPQAQPLLPYPSAGVRTTPPPPHISWAYHHHHHHRFDTLGFWGKQNVSS